MHHSNCSKPAAADFIIIVLLLVASELPSANPQDGVVCDRAGAYACPQRCATLCLVPAPWSCSQPAAAAARLSAASSRCLPEDLQQSLSIQRHSKLLFDRDCLISLDTLQRTRLSIQIAFAAPWRMAQRVFVVFRTTSNSTTVLDKNVWNQSSQNAGVQSLNPANGYILERSC